MKRLILPILLLLLLGIFAAAEDTIQTATDSAEPVEAATVAKAIPVKAAEVPAPPGFAGKPLAAARALKPAATSALKEKAQNTRPTLAAKPMIVKSAQAAAAECIDDATSSELNRLMEKYKIASQQNDDSAIQDIKSKIQAMKQQMGQNRKDCIRESKPDNLGRMVSEAVKGKNGSAKDIVAYYKLRMAEMVAAQNTSAEIERLKELRTELDQMISSLIAGQDKVDANELRELVREIRVSRNEIAADKIKINAARKAVKIKLKDRLAEIKPNDAGAALESEGVSAVADELSYTEDGGIKIGASEVLVLPSQIAEKLKIQAKEMRLVEENNRSLYKLRPMEKRMILGVYPVTMQKEMTADGQSGELISEKKPWWSFATTAATEAKKS